MNIKLKKPSLSNLNNIFSSRKKLLMAVLSLAIIAGSVAAIVIFQQNKEPVSEEKAYEKVVEVNQLRSGGDCQKGLQQLSSYNTKKVNLSQPVVQETVSDVLKYRVDCYYELANYDQALTYAAELKQLYEKYGGSDYQNQEINKKIELIKADQESSNSIDEVTEKSRNAKDNHAGPRL